MNESVLNHYWGTTTTTASTAATLVTTTTTTTTIKEEEQEEEVIAIENGNGIEDCRELSLYNHNHNNIATTETAVQKRRYRKINPVFGSEAEAQAAEDLEIQRALIQKNEEERLHRIEAAKNVFIPTTLDNYIPLTSLSHTAETTLVHSSFLDQPQGEHTDKQVVIHYFAPGKRPCKYPTHTEKVIYWKGSLIIVHKLFPYQEDRVLFLTFPHKSTYAEQPHRSSRIKVSRFQFVQDKLNIFIGKPKERPFDSLFGWQKEPSASSVEFNLQSMSDPFGIAYGLWNYLKGEEQESSTQTQVKVTYDSVIYVSESGEEEIDYCVDVETEVEVDQNQQPVGILEDPLARAESNEYRLHILTSSNPEIPLSTLDTLNSNLLDTNSINNHIYNNTHHSLPVKVNNYHKGVVFINAASVAIPRTNKRKQLVSSFIQESNIVPDTIETNGVHVPVPRKKYKARTGSILSRKKAKDSAPGMENRPKNLKGFVARCPHCGISSGNLHKCDRCKKLIPASAPLLPDPIKVSDNAIPPEAIRRKSVRAPPSEEIVVLSSDEETSEEVAVSNNKEKEKETEMLPPPGNSNGGTMNVNLQKGIGTAISRHGGGKTILQPKKSITTYSAPIVKSVMREKTHHVHVSPSSVKTSEIQHLPTSSPALPVSAQGKMGKQILSHAVTMTSMPVTSLDGTELVPEDKLSPMRHTQPRILIKMENHQNYPAKYQNGNIIPSPSAYKNSNPHPPPGNPNPGPGNEGRSGAMEIPVTEVNTNPTSAPKGNTPEEVVRLTEQLEASGEVTGSLALQKLSCRFIRIGSYKTPTSSVTHTQPQVYATVSTYGIVLEVPHTSGQTFLKMGIPIDGILTAQTHLVARLPVLIIQTSPSSTSYLRRMLGLSDSPNMPNYYDPTAGGPTEKRIIICVDNNIPNLALAKAIIHRIFGSMIKELDYAHANQILLESTPSDDKKQKQGKPSTSTASATASSSKSTGETKISITKVESLAPNSSTPVQAQAPVHVNNASTVAARTRGSARQAEPPVVPHVPKDLLSLSRENSNLRMTLHSGDVICLAEEQFLNDQILDFWMWWISVTKLSEKDRERTHIFSTFFYKSLTTRPKRRSCAPWENDRTLTTAEKRHCRVKKWTKNVDIFSKDFIMVPINENAHWFMAVICFPGIEGICNMDDGKPRPDIKNRDTVKKKRTVVKDEEDEAIVDPDRDEEAGAPEEEIESETDDEVLADAEEEAAAEEEARKNGVTPNFDALVKRSARFRHPPVKQPCIITFDSMNEPRNRVLATLRAYVRIEMKVRKGIERRFDRLDMPGYNAKVPDQPNHYDCGIYLLQYFESFFTKPLQSFLLPIKYLRKWFPESIVHTKRREIYNAIFEIVKTEHPENLPNFPALKFKFQDETAPAPAQAEVPALPQEPTPAESPAPAPEPVPGPSKAKRPKLDNIEEDNE